MNIIFAACAVDSEATSAWAPSATCSSLVRAALVFGVAASTSNVAVVPVADASASVIMPVIFLAALAAFTAFVFCYFDILRYYNYL